MNRIYRLIWNVRTGTWIAACEHARTRGKRGGSLRMLAMATAMLGACAAHAADPAALPEGGRIVAGSGSIGTSGATMTVTQNSDKLITNWNSFSIGSQASVNFVQPGTASIALNRVTGSDPSYLYGHLSANGRVFLINPSGVLFGPTARVDVGGLVASTLGLDDQDFLNGRYRFANAGGAGGVANQGRINGGVVALLGPRVSNLGVINAPGGSVALAAGDRIGLDLGGDGMVTANVQQAAVNALAENKGLIQADGGTVVMTAQSAGDLLSTVVNNDGIIQARGLSQHDGRIVLDGGDAGVTRAAGTLDASSAAGHGGSIVVSGDKVLVDEGARLDATGATGGGAILAGGGWQGGDPSIRQARATTIARSALLDASATGNGNGGTVVAWSDVHDANSATRAFGTFRANGGANGGDGGRIETSGHWLDTQGARGSAAAPAGKGGSWLLDPYDVTIDTSASSNGSFTTGNWSPSGSGSTVLNTDVDALLNGGTSVTISTSGAGAEAGDITVNAPVTKSSGSGDVTLTLAADHSILVNQNIANTGGTGKLNVVLDSNSADGGSGGILMASGTSIVTNGGDITLSGGSNTATGFALGAANTGDRGIWMQQNTMLDASGTAAGGNIILRGNGTTTGEGMLIGWGGSGPASTIKTNGAGSISMNGTGGGQSSGRWVTGVSLWNTATQTDSGAINITGTGGAANGTDDNSGVMLNTNGVTTDNRIVSASGAINITGVRGTGTTSTGGGIWFGGGSHAIGQDGTLVASSSSNITLKTDMLKIDSGLLQSSGALAIQPYTASATIGVGAGSGTLSLPQSYFWNGSSGNIKDGFSGITIGRADGTGAIDVNGLSFSDPLTLLGGAGVNATLAGTIANAGSGTASGSLTVKVGGDISSTAAITTQNQAVLFNADSDANGAGAIALNAGSSIASNGGNVTLGGGADPTQDAATGTAFGVALNSGAKIDAGGGNISMVGQGGTADTNAGVNLNFGSSIQTTGNGSITLTGTGGSAGTYRNGVMLDRASVSAQNGSIDITGTAGAGASSYGVTQQVSGSVTSNGSGAINITGIGTNGILTTGTSQFGGPSATGAITLSADTMSLASTTSVQGTGTLLIQPHTAGTSIGVGDGAGGTLSLAGSTLDALADGFSSITIGNTDASAIDARSYTFKDPLLLQNGNNVFIRGALATGSGLQAGSITVRTTGSILLDSTPVGSITTQGQGVTLDADSDGNQNGNIRLLYGSSIATNGGAITLGGGADPATTAAWGNTAGGHVSDMSGVYIERTTVNSGGGDISIRGSGVSAGAVADSVGVMIENGSTIDSGSGKIAITGVGALGGATGNMGVNIRYQDAFGKISAGGSTITSASTAADAIVINGTGSTTGAANSAGVTVQNGSSINATGAGGGIAITGTGGSGGDSANHGIFFDTNTALNIGSGNLALTGTGGSGAQGLDFTGTSTIGSAASSGAFAFSADTMNFGGGAIAGSGALLIQPLAASTGIGIGDSATGTLNLAGSELDKLADGFSSITIGRSDGSGAIDVRSHTFNDPLTIRTPTGSGNITVNGALATGSGTQAGSITLQAGDSIALASLSSITTQGQAVVAGANADASNGGAIAITSASVSTHGGAITLGGGATPATVAATGTSASHHGVGLSGATLDSAGGDITVRGAGYAADGASGVDIGNASQITSGTGNVLINGTGAGGGGNQRRGIVLYGASKIHDSHDISLYGSADAASTDYNTGIDLDGTGGGSISGDGAIYLEGHGGGTGINGHGISVGGNFTTSALGSGTLTLVAVGSSGQSGDGMFYHGTLSTVSGDLSITATGHAAGDSTGLYLHNGSTVSSTSGKVTINATGAGSSGATYGLHANPGVTIYSQSGAVDITATAGSGSPALYLNDATVGYASGTGPVTLSADTMDLAAASTLQGNGALLIQPLTASTTIGLGDSAGGTLNLDGTELGYLQNGFSSITIGRSDGSGAVDVRGHTFNDPLTIRTPTGSGNITVNGALATGSGTQAGSITLQSGNNLALAASSSITTQGQAVTLDADSDASSAGTVTLNSGSSIASNGGNIVLGGGADPTTGYAAGAKAVWLNGTSIDSGGGDVLLRGKGRGANGSADTPGIKIESSTIDSGTGAVTLAGDSFDGSAGIFLASGAAITSAKTNGTAISITGNAGQTLASDNSPGLLMIDASLTATGSGGDITLAGLGGVSNTSGNTFNAKGVAIAGGAASTIQAEGKLTISGTARADAGDNSVGVSIENYSGNIGARGGITITGNSQKPSIADVQLRQDSGSNTLGSSTTSSVTLVGDRMALAVGAGATAIQTAANGTVSLLPRSAGQAISLGAADSGTALGIDNTELNRITTGTLFIGRDYNDSTAPGALSVDGTLDFSAAKLPAIFLRGTDITFDQGLTKDANGDAALTVQASNNIALNTDANIAATGPGKLAVTLNADRDADGSGSITLADGAGVASNGGDITLGGGNTGFTALPAFDDSGYATALTATAAHGAGGAAGISLGSSTLDAGGGNIVLRGVGADGVASASGITGSATIQTSGSGTIALDGIGGNGTDHNRGVELTGATVSSADGAITLQGTGGGSTTENSGMRIDNNGATRSLVSASGSGNVTIKGLGSTGGDDNDGVVIQGSTVQTADGTLTLDGTGRGSGTGSDGVELAGSSIAQATGTGAVSLNGTSSATGASANRGIAVWLSSAARSASGALTLQGTSADAAHGAAIVVDNGTLGSGSQSGSITLTADTMDLGNAAAVQSTGTLIVHPLTAATSIGIGGGAGTLQLPASYFNGGAFSNSLSAITIGDTGAGALTAGTTPFGTDTRLVSGADIAINGALDASGKTLTLSGSSGGSVSGTGNITAAKLLLDGSGTTYRLGSAAANSVGTLAANGASSIDFKNSGSLTVGSVGAVDGVTASGDITLEAGGTTADLTLSKPVTTTNGTIVAAAGRNFINTTTTDTGLAPGSGRYLVYSTNPSSSTEGMTGYGKHYNQTYSAGTTPSYAGSGNWFLYSTAPTLTVTPGAQTITYGDAAPGFTPSYSGFIDGDTGSTAGISGSATFSVGGTTSSAGKYTAGSHDVSYSAGLASSLGYQFQDDSSSAGELTVNAKTLSLSGFAASGKVYDGATTATISSAGSLAGVLSGDAVVANNTGATFADKNVGTGKTVTLNGVSLGGTDSGNYSIAGSATTTADITAKALTLSGFAADNKIYDGTTAATIADAGNLAGVINGDNVTISNSGATFADKNVGTGKTVTLNGVSLGGTDSSNYSIAGSATATADITAKTLTLSGFAANNKVYDGTTTATIANAGSLSGVIGSDHVTASNTGATFADKNAGTNKTVTLNGISLSGTDSGNYSIAGSAAATADIIPRTLTLSGFAADNKIYDGNTTATIANAGSLAGVISGDNVTVGNTGATFADKNAGTNKTVTLNGVSLNGADSNNYSIAGNATGTADITARPLGVTLTSTIGKIQDGTAAASLSPGNFRLDGFVAGEDATVTKTSGSYDSADAGSGKLVTATLTARDFSPASGTLLSNYALPTSASAPIGSIMAPRSLENTLSEVTSRQVQGPAPASGTPAETGASRVSAGIGAGMPGVSGLDGLVMNNIPARQSPGMMLSTNAGTRPVAFSESGGTVALGLGGGSGSPAHSESALQLLVVRGSRIESQKSFDVIDQGNRLLLRSASATAQTVPDIAKIDGRRTTASLTLPDGSTRELQIRLSADGILLIHLPDGGSQALDERQVALLALSAAKTNLDAPTDAISAAVIAR